MVRISTAGVFYLAAPENNWAERVHPYVADWMARRLTPTAGAEGTVVLTARVAAAVPCLPSGSRPNRPPHRTLFDPERLSTPSSTSRH